MMETSSLILDFQLVESCMTDLVMIERLNDDDDL